MNGELALVAIDTWKVRFIDQALARLALAVAEQEESTSDSYDIIVTRTAAEELRCDLLAFRDAYTIHREHILEYSSRREQ